MIKTTIAIIVLLTTLMSCATVFRSSYETIEVTSIPDSAGVYVDAQYKGETPISFQVKRGTDYMIDIRKAKFYEAHYILASDIDYGWVLADALFTGFWGVIVDGVTSKWCSVKENKIKIILRGK